MQSRITITIPKDLVDAADEKAQSMDRSRSWVLVEALRRYLRPAQIHEPVAHPYSVSPATQPGAPVDVAAEVAASRKRRLRAEYTLPPLERLRRAEDIARLGEPSNRARASVQVVGFDNYEDYYAWKKNRLIRL